MEQSFYFLLLTSISLFYTFHLCAQSQVQGRIVDEQGEPLALANILLYTAADSAFVKGAIADELGAFRFADLEPGAFRCQASMVGYPSGPGTEQLQVALGHLHGPHLRAV